MEIETSILHMKLSFFILEYYLGDFFEKFYVYNSNNELVNLNGFNFIHLKVFSIIFHNKISSL